MSISRRTFIGTSAAGVAVAASNPAAFAQDEKPTVTVGSTHFTEQHLLGEMLVALLQENGYPTGTEHNLAGSVVIHEARNSGDIDVHSEYTGTALTILEKSVSDIKEEGDTPEEITEKVNEVVRVEYEENWNAIWLDPFGFNNTYALAMRRADVEEHGLEKISDLAPIADDLILASSQEFLIREDGMPGIEELYGFEFGDAMGMDVGLMYSALEQGDVNIIAAYSTDGRIRSMDFVLLEDDLGFFPPYHAIPVVRGQLLEQAPELREVLNSMAGKIDESKMQGLNFRVDDGGEEVTNVARDFLATEGLIGSA